MATTLSQFEDHSIPSAPKEFSVWVSKEHNHLSKACFNLQRHRFSQIIYSTRSEFSVRLVVCRMVWKRALPSQPIKCHTKPNHDLVIRVFPRVCRLVFTMSFRWLFTVFCYLLIGGHDYFDIPLRILSRKAC